MEIQIQLVHLVLGLLAMGLVLGTGLVIYAHKNFISKDQFESHREDSRQRDTEIKDWLVRIEHKLDAIIQNK